MRPEQRAYLKGWVESARAGEPVDGMDAEDVEDMLTALSAAEATVDRLRAALRRHGRHSQAWGDDGSVLPEACDIYRRKPCSCGLDAALADDRPTTGERCPSCGCTSDPRTSGCAACRDYDRQTTGEDS